MKALVSRSRYTPVLTGLGPLNPQQRERQHDEQAAPVDQEDVAIHLVVHHPPKLHLTPQEALSYCANCRLFMSASRNQEMTERFDCDTPLDSFGLCRTTPREPAQTAAPAKTALYK